MAKLDIVTLPDPVLRKLSDPVEGMSEAIQKLLDDMLETMYEAPGIGLAAIQVGVPKRVITIDVSREEDKREPLFLVNPQIVWRSDDPNVHEEGCLSIPEYFAEVERPARVKVTYHDYDGKEQELEADGLLATCIQHEVDHLNGVLFIDYLSKLKRDMVIRRFTKAAREKERSASSAM
ncbi:peptide deformylase [Afifella sp. YEN Y35]|uniref:peptide deformylase n=1 Tax=Afifella sp. YEN Y35 TaxID=3388337 RepID=UPI0039E0D982